MSRAPATDRRPVDRDLVATLALGLYSWIVAIGFARVFSGWAFLSDLTVIVIVGHGLSFALRRARVSGWVAVPAVLLAMLWVVAFQNYRTSFGAVFPTWETWDIFKLETDLVRDQFKSTRAPVIYGAGWSTLSGLAMAFAVVLGDTFAFRADARGESLVPGGVLFVFIAALGYQRINVLASAVLLAAGFLAVVALRALHDRTRRVELIEARGPASLVGAAALGGAAAVAVIAGVIGPRVPGAGADALYDTRGRNGGVTEIISPLVEIRGRLVKQSSNELFRVDASEGAYWRLTTLSEFDGNSFRLPQRRIEQVDGSLRAAGPGVEIRQDVEIVGLGGPLVPAAAEPIQATGPERLRWNADTSTLVVVGEDLDSGDRITVVSTAQRPTPDELRSAGTANVPDPIYLELPDDLPGRVAELTAEVTAGAATPYDAVLALQTWFREDFTYSLEVPQGHGTAAIEVFLRERVGYCEQFAATFAAMARTLDIPSRVAVGFTPGLQMPDGRYSVLGKNAHAWPEVWFDGVGWVPFEPTPGRGAPGAEQFTGVAPAQDSSPGEATEGNGAAPAPTTTVVLTPGSDETLDDADFIPDAGERAEPPVAPVEEDDGLPWRELVLVVLSVLVLVLPTVVRHVRRRLRRRAPAEERVLAAWQRAAQAVRRAGVPSTRAMTPMEVAVATSAVLPVAARPMRELADTVEAVVFGPPGAIDLDTVGPYGSTVSRECGAWAHQVEEIARDTLPTKTRVVDYFVDWN